MTDPPASATIRHRRPTSRAGLVLAALLGIVVVVTGFRLLAGHPFGWPEDAVTLRPLQSVPNMISAVKSGQVDAIILPAHIVKPLDAAGAAHIVAAFGKIVELNRNRLAAEG